jgi:isochorismate synthase
MAQKDQNIQNLLLQAISEGQGLVLYKLPGEEVCSMLTGPLKPVSSLPANEDGFIVSPFNKQKTAYFLKTENTTEFTVIKIPENDAGFYYSEEKKIKYSTENEFCDLVQEALLQIKKENLQKVVLSRAKGFELGPEFNVTQFFSVLANNYKNAFVYLFSAPQTGTWIGASPELLIEKKGNNIRTMALAGTIRNTEKNKETETAFTSKEINEQQLVTDYILEVLKKYADEIAVNGPEIKAAGNISHLITNFKASIKKAENQCFPEIIQALHPTPAVCGIPKEKALNFILENEGYDRAFYSGYLGPISNNGDADIFVNLRCMQLFEKTAVLYAGAGIVEGSEPQKEWLETAQKMNTLLQYLPHNEHTERN